MQGRVTGFCLFFVVIVMVGSSWGYTETNNNNFFGTGAGEFSNGGGSDTFVGAFAGYENYTGSNNSSFGYEAGGGGNNNSFIGYQSGANNITGNNNSFVGYQSGANDNPGNDNSFVGFQAGKNNTGNNNIFVGSYAGYGNTTGQNNISVGYQAGYSYDDVHFVALGTGQNNSFFGTQAGYGNTTGYNNSFVGFNTGVGNTTGYNNSFVGFNAGANNATGHINSFFGVDAGLHNSGSGNVFIGSYAGLTELGDNMLYIDNCYHGGTTTCSSPLIKGDFNNQLVWINGALTATSFSGNGSGLTNISASAVTGMVANAATATSAGTCTSATTATSAGTCTSTAQIGSNTTNYIPRWSGTQLVSGIISDDGSAATVNGALTVVSIVSVSDERYKRNILPLQLSLDKVERLTGVSYEWKTEEYAGKGFKEGKQIGFIAQDVEKVFPELVLTGADGYKAVAYDKLVPVLVEAVKEQHKEMKEKDIQYETSLKDKDARIEKLERALETIERRMASLSPSKTIALK